MKKTKIFIAITVLAMCTLFLAACGNSDSGESKSTEKEAEYIFKCGHTVSDTHSYQLGLEKFRDLLEEKTDGRATVEIYPAAQLGNENDLVESTSMGTLDMCLSNSANLQTYTDAYMAFDMPCIFETSEKAHAVLDSEIGQEALDQLRDDVNIQGLANWENGFFCLWNNKKAINSAEDYKGLKIRANNNQIHIDSYSALGASATTMGWSEVYTAIQNGTVDGVAVSIPSLSSSNIQEVAPYISDSGEFYVTVILMMNADLYDELPEDIRTAVTEAAKETTAYQRKVNQQQTDEVMKTLEEEGYAITHPDRSEIKEACWDEVYEKYADRIGKDTLEKIQNFEY